MAKRCYHVVVINERTGKKVRMSASPVTHTEGVKLLSALTDYKWRRKQLEPAKSCRGYQPPRKWRR